MRIIWFKMKVGSLVLHTFHFSCQFHHRLRCIAFAFALLLLKTRDCAWSVGEWGVERLRVERY